MRGPAATRASDGKRNRFSGDCLTSTMLTWTDSDCYSCSEFYIATSICRQLLILQIRSWTPKSKEINAVIHRGTWKQNTAGQTQLPCTGDFWSQYVCCIRKSKASIGKRRVSGCCKKQIRESIIWGVQSSLYFLKAENSVDSLSLFP